MYSFLIFLKAIKSGNKLSVFIYNSKLTGIEIILTYLRFFMTAIYEITALIASE